MEELKEKLSEYFNKTKKYYTILDLKKEFNLYGEEKTNILENILKELEEEGTIYFDEKKGYIIFENNKKGLAFGQIEINKNGNGYVHTKDGYTIFIESTDLNGALSKDLVVISNIVPKGKEYKGTIEKIVKRDSGKAIFKVIGNGLNATLIPYNNNYNINVELNKNQRMNLIDGQIIEISLNENDEYGYFIGSIEKIIGYESDPDIDIKILAEEFGIELGFSNEELEQAKNMPTKVSEEEIKDRVDLRDKNFITIDCDNTKDRDDAIYLEKLDNGNYKLYVSIAAVNYYIKKGTPLYEGINRRCTSHYPNNTCIPMLPRTISNGICSLNELEDRLTKTCEMEIDKNGKIINYKIYNSVINSKKAMKYSLVNKLLDGQQVDEYDQFKDMLIEMQKLSEILSKKRKSLEFKIPETEVKKENDENVFYANEQKKAEKLIENFMVITDATVANHFYWLPLVYRIHECPKQESVEQAIKKLNCAGLHIKLSNGVDAITIKKILDKLNKLEDYQIFDEILLRSMPKAKYSTDKIGHFALQLANYCHFTSPIRRIADYTIHSTIDDAKEQNYNIDYLNSLEKEQKEISKNASKAEILNKKFESEALKMAMAEEVKKHIGETYSGIITGIYPYGVFVRTDNLIEGKVSLDNIYTKKGKCRYNQEMDAIVVVGGEKTIYHIGDKVEVKSIDASKENRTISFALTRKK